MEQELAVLGGLDESNEDLRSSSQRRRWPLRVGIGVLVVALVVTGTGYYLSYRSAQDWSSTARQRAADLASTVRQRDALATQLTAAQDELNTTKSTLADTTTKYNQATDRIRSLANEKAQVGDQAALLAEAVALSSHVSTELNACVNNLQRLELLLVNFQSYDIDVVISLTEQINAGCNQAKSDNAALAQKLGSA